MRFIQVPIVNLYQFDTLIFLECGQFFELLAEHEDSQFHWRILSSVIEVCNCISPLFYVIDLFWTENGRVLIV